MLLFLRVSIWHKKDSECIGHCTKWTKYNFIYICSSESDSQQTILKLCMLEIRCFVQDPEKHSVATLMPSGLNNYYIGACGCGRVNTKIQMALFSATVLKDAFIFYFFLFFNILLEYLEGKNHLGSEKTAKCLAALMDFMLLNQKFILLFAFLTLRSNYINYSNLSVIYIVN